jgi:hypothetical protein
MKGKNEMAKINLTVTIESDDETIEMIEQILEMSGPIARRSHAKKMTDSIMDTLCRVFQEERRRETKVKMETENNHGLVIRGSGNVIGSGNSMVITSEIK